MNSQYKVRSTFVFFMFCLLYGIILLNLYFIQIKQHEFFTRLGEKQYLVTLTQTPPRAPIYDRSGTQCLALNKDCTSAFIMPKHVGESEKLEQFLETHFPKSHERYLQRKDKNFMFVQRKLTDAQLTAIETADIKDIKLLKEPNRFYPVQAACTIVGMTNIDNKGIAGIELACNEKLAGKPTTHVLEKDARSGRFHFKKETTKQGHEGTPIQLTIDSDLQFLVHEQLKKTVDDFGAQEGSAIVMDPKTGEILAMACIPDFDPNNTQQLNIAHTKNRTVTESYELGSVMKVFAGLAALEEGAVELNETIDCKDAETAYVEGRKVNTWKAHGEIPFHDVIAFSNNIGIAQVAQRIDYKLHEHYTRLGFGTKSGIGFPGEQKGFVNPPHKWSKQSIISLSYGYEIMGTILQLAHAFSIIANDGFEVKPKLVMNSEKPPKGKQLYSPESIKAIRSTLEKTTKYGTARGAKIPGCTIMAKTGTTNILVNGKYAHDKNMFTCAGIIQKDTYKRVVVTFVRQASRSNLYAAQVAVPLFKRIAQKTLVHDRMV